LKMSYLSLNLEMKKQINAKVNSEKNKAYLVSKLHFLIVFM